MRTQTDAAACVRVAGSAARDPKPLGRMSE